MSNQEIEQSLNTIRQICETIQPPFPYEDCFRIIEAHPDDQLEAFIPSLDLFFWDIAAFCGREKRWTAWDAERLTKALEMIRASFFQRHPEYSSARSLITAEATPRLSYEMEAHENLRTQLVSVLEHLLTERGSCAGPTELPNA